MSVRMADSACSSSMIEPPTLTTTTRSWNRWMYDSASTRALAFSEAWLIACSIATARVSCGGKGVSVGARSGRCQSRMRRVRPIPRLLRSLSLPALRRGRGAAQGSDSEPAAELSPRILRNLGAPRKSWTRRASPDVVTPLQANRGVLGPLQYWKLGLAGSPILHPDALPTHAHGAA